ncbi:hypothetical protein [Candidatus Phytoplasma pruni]|uniref:Uncharacterized protein n=1 Tax=Candidatus Phytoplasma pruni TaxID=479893 RepID=A0A851H9U9_9MOLU|nr:hypothetical protein [Candidatus Phytoplasma pruni]NWN45712.1 hypothetical protein [Candidatus Phytoplasma pruni]
MKNIYSQAYQQQLKINLNKFDIKDSKVQNKIHNFCKKFGFNHEEVIQNISTNPFLKSFFIKDPSHQNVYKKTLFSHLQTIPFINKLQLLETDNEQPSYIVQQKVVHDSPVPTGKVKSADIYFKINGLPYDFYVYHKYTKNKGGSQDSQKNEIIKVMQTARNLTGAINKKIKVLIVLDGNYYTNKILKELQTSAPNNFHILNSTHIAPFLKQLQ